MLTKSARGTYVLVLHTRGDLDLEVGALGAITFKAGWYMYVGSAMSGLRVRLRRHFNKKKLGHWHIDYLTNVARIDGAALLVSSDRLECRVADKLKAGLASIAGFGCSDCECGSHLFFSACEAGAWNSVESALTGFDVERHHMRSKDLRAFSNHS